MNELTEEERKLLKTISSKGPMTLIEISVEQLQMPDQIEGLINDLEKKGYISKKRLRSGPEAEVVTLSQKGVKAIKE